MADETTQPQLSQPGGGAFDWGAADSARRENIAQGHQRIREKVNRNLPARRGPDWEWGRKQGQALQARGPNWEYGDSGSEGEDGSGGGGERGGSPGGGSAWGGEPGTTGGGPAKLGAMFRNPHVRDEVERISNRWELTNQIRRGGMHAAIRHAFGLPLFPSHKDDYIRARQTQLNTNPNAGQNPGYYQPSDI